MDLIETAPWHLDLILDPCKISGMYAVVWVQGKGMQECGRKTVRAALAYGKIQSF